jgi:alpha-tubulin suppressor-like RCC1 family protein
MTRTLVALGLALVAAACGDADPAGPEPPPSALRYSIISGGYYHTCGLAISGAAYCWGDNAFGTLGDGSRTARTQPARVAGSTLFSTLDAGAGHNCALSTTGDAFCWGQNDEGQLGDASLSIRDRPAAVDADLSFIAISAGHAHSCALTAAGTAWCWGDNSRGQLGNPAAVGRATSPVQVLAFTPFTRIHAGYYQTCALDSSGAAWCWGLNDSGQLGDGSTEDRAAPTPVHGGLAFSDLAPGDRFVCGIAESQLHCWGAARSHELGFNAASPAPLLLFGVPASAVVTSMGASTIPSVSPYGCVLRRVAVECWGGAIRALRAAAPSPDPLDPPVRAAALAAGADHVCVLSTAGYAYCGGGNYFGQLGDGTRTDRPALVAIPGPIP